MIKDEPSKAIAKGENRISKYMLYAMGEIILVVINILISPIHKTGHKTFPSLEGTKGWVQNSTLC